MKNVVSVSEREVWVDNIKVVACVLVVLGHFLSSLMLADILPNYPVLQWFEKIIYYFHVPLFFICSGYLYQKSSKFECWKKHVLKKALALGIPYITFSTVTWGLKTIFSSSVNNKIDNGLFEMLFLKPIAPYWYLYTLFLIFLITPQFKSKRRAVLGLGMALLIKTLSIIGIGHGVYAISTIVENEIWFISGMCLQIIDFRTVQKSKNCLCVGLTFAVLFGGISTIIFSKKIDVKGLEFLMGGLACAAVVLLIGYIFRNNDQKKMFGFLSKYTFPIFLLHTIFAAPVRIILIKIGIVNTFIHVMVGGIVSFVVPVIFAKIAEQFKGVNFFMYPTKYMKII